MDSTIERFGKWLLDRVRDARARQAYAQTG
jgi:hypothetical protein